MNNFCKIFLFLALISSLNLEANSTNSFAEKTQESTSATIKEITPQKTPFDSIFKLKPNFNHIISQFLEPLHLEGSRSCRDLLREPGSLEEKLNACEYLARQVIWQRPDGVKVRYPDWSRAQKDRINQIFERIVNNERDLNVQCPVLENNVNVDIWRIYISEAQAFDIYAAHIAQSLYLESENLVSWSLLDNSLDENQSILDSSQYFSIINRTSEGGLSVVRERFGPGTSYRLPSWQYGGNILSCDPRIPYWFLSGRNSSSRSNLIGFNQFETLKAISWWFHKNAYHAENTDYPTFDQWRTHEVFLPDRLNVTTYRVGKETFQGVRMNKGCHSAANLFLELARGLNIPVRIFWVSEQPFIRDIFTYANIHMGIAYHWTQEDYKVVIHLDELYLNHKSIFPIEHSRPLTERDFQENFINQLWISPAQAMAWGLHFYRDLPLLLPGQDVNQTVPPIVASEPDEGYFGGYGEMRNTTTGVYSMFENKIIENAYQLCGWNEFLREYCEDRSPMRLNFYGQMYYNVNGNFASTVPPLPFVRTVDDYISRAEECVNNNGGCAHIETEVSQDYRLHGSNYYVR